MTEYSQKKVQGSRALTNLQEINWILKSSGGPFLTDQAGKGSKICVEWTKVTILRKHGKMKWFHTIDKPSVWLQLDSPSRTEVIYAKLHTLTSLGGTVYNKSSIFWLNAKSLSNCCKWQLIQNEYRSRNIFYTVFLLDQRSIFLPPRYVHIFFHLEHSSGPNDWLF